MAESNGVYIPVNLNVDDAEKQIKKLQSDIANIEVKKVKLSVEIESNDKMLGELKARLAELQEQYKQLGAAEAESTVRENGEYIVEQTEKRKQAEEELANAIADRQRIQEETAQYQENLKTETDPDERAYLQGEIEDYPEKMALVEERIQSAANKVEEFRENISAAKEENREIFDSHVIDRGEELRKKIEEIKTEIGATEADGEKLREKFAEATQETNNLTQVAEALQKQGGDLGQTAEEVGGAVAQSQTLIAGLGAKAGAALGIAVVVGTKAAKVFAKVGKGVMAVSQKFNPLTKISGVAQKAFHRLGMTLRRVFVFSVLTSGMRQLRQMVSKILKANKELAASLKTLKGAFLTAFQPIISAVIPILTRLVQWLTTVMMAIARLTAGLFGKTAKQAQAGAKALDKEAKSAGKAAKSLAGIDEINKLDAPSGDDGGATFDAEADDTLDSSKGETYLKFLQGFSEGIRDVQRAFQDAIPSINEFWSNMYDALSNPDITLEFAIIGTSLAKLINTALYGIDWSTIGQTLGLGLMHAIEMAYHFLETVDWKEMGKAISDIFNGVVKSIDWRKFGRMLMDYLLVGLNVLYGAIINLDVKQLVGSLGSFFLGALERFVGWLRSVNWFAVAKKIFEFFHYAITEIKWGEVAKNIFLGLVEGIWAFVQIVAAAVVDVIHLILDLFKKLLGIHSPSTVFADFGKMMMEGLINGIKGMLNAIKSALEAVWKAIKDGAKAAWDALTEFFKKRWETIKSNWNTAIDVFSNIWNRIKEGFANAFAKVKEVWETVTSAFGNGFSKAWEKIKGIFSKGGAIFSGITEGIANAFKKIVNSLIGGINKVVAIPFNAINTVLRKIRDVTILGIQPFKNLVGTISVPQIPYLAQGTVVPPNKEFLAMLGDNKRETEVVSPLSTMKEALLEALAESGLGNQNVSVFVDGRELFDIIVGRNNAEVMRTGKTRLAT